VPSTELPETLRREIFQAIVEAQDDRVSVARSREQVAARYGVSEAQIRHIESEGIDNDWPPLTPG
jgi:RecA-family ATPase